MAFAYSKKNLLRTLLLKGHSEAIEIPFVIETSIPNELFVFLISIGFGRPGEQAGEKWRPANLSKIDEKHRASVPRHPRQRGIPSRNRRVEPSKIGDQRQ